MRASPRAGTAPVDQPGSDTAVRRMAAVARTRAACDMLATRGVTARVVGSLAAGRFGPSSDIDLLVTACPRHLKYAIEGLVEDCLGDFRFDVIYLDEVPPHKIDRLVRDAIDARDLR